MKHKLQSFTNIF